MSALFWTNTPSWIFIVLAHWNNKSVGRHVAPLGHISLIHPVFVLTPWCFRESTNTDCIVFGLTHTLEPTFYSIRGKYVYHYTNVEVEIEYNDEHMILLKHKTQYNDEHILVIKINIKHKTVNKNIKLSIVMTI